MNTITQIAKAIILSAVVLCISTADIFATTVYARNDGDWDITSNWSTSGVGGSSCSCIPGINDTVVIDGYLMDIDDNTGNVTIARLTITNDNGNQSDLSLEGSIKLTISGDLIALAEDESEAVDLYVKNNTELEVQGDVLFERVASNEEDGRLRLKTQNNGIADFQGDFTFNWLNADEESSDEIFMTDDSQILVAGDMVIYKDGGNDSGNDKFTLDMDKNVILDIEGTLTITQDGNYDVRIEMTTSARINVESDMDVILNTGDDVLFFMDNDAVIDVEGDLTFDHNGGDDMVIDLDNSSIIDVNGDLIMDIDATGSDLMRLDLDASSSLIVGGDLQMIAYTSGSCEIRNDDNVIIYLYGDLTRRAAPNNYGLIVSDNNSEIHFVGTAAQELPQSSGAGSDELDFSNITINNTYATAPQLSMEGDMYIRESITLTDGIIQTTSGSQIYLNDDCTSTSGSADSHIDGPMTKIGDDDFVFPIGNNGRWRRLALDNFSGTSNEFEAQYFYTSHADPANKVADLDLVSTLEYWNLDRVVADGGTPEVILHWENADSSGIQNLTQLRVSRYNSGTPEWESEGNSNTTGAVGASSGSVTSTTGLTSFGNLTFGSQGFGNVLPVELVSFEAELTGDAVLVNWETVNEINNDRFEVLRSTNGIDFEVIGIVKGGGTMAGGQSYEYIDEEPNFGSNYYQLRQVDFDDKSDVSNIEHVNNNLAVDDNFGVKIFPNPINSGQSLNIEYDIDEDPNAQFLVVLYDITGRELYSQIALQENGKAKTAMAISNDLPNGIYMVVGSSSKKIEFKERIVIGSPSFGSSASLSGR